MLTYPTCICHLRWGVTPFFGIRKVPELSCGVICVILRLAVSVEYRLVTDGRTDAQTDGQTHDDS